MLDKGYSRNFVLANFVNAAEFKNLCAGYGVKQGYICLLYTSYDIDAVDEALINALVHNDWSISEPLVSMFNDRLEIISYGGLPYKQTKEQFLKGVSIPRNLSLIHI